MGLHVPSVSVETETKHLKTLNQADTKTAAMVMGLISDSLTFLGGELQAFAKPAMSDTPAFKSAIYVIDTLLMSLGFPLHDPDDPERTLHVASLDQAVWATFLAGSAIDTVPVATRLLAAPISPEHLLTSLGLHLTTTQLGL
ncbi:hypothetical protein [Xanthovirga aplysinae]|uniref:hypothetical protein n=1 Tax=Xanthovirga aplysinae TaxID=2529853 RepID=UPI0012BD19C7|nr:hypothetical protein [Xanthovirga aplysinae]MTI29496.1 hypothetical protein [Xanthovirga aplysinae]